jgi:hypothetical protein
LALASPQVWEQFLQLEPLQPGAIPGRVIYRLALARAACCEQFFWQQRPFVR